MKPTGCIARIVSIAAIALAAQALPAHAMVVVTAPAAHTGTPASAERAHARHPLHHRARHHPALARYAHHHAAERPGGQPRHPAAPRRSEHRAALPHGIRAHRHHSGSRASSRQAMAAPAQGIMLAVTVRQLDERQNETISDYDDPVTSSRGPPRASPFSDLHPVSDAGPRITLRPASPLPPSTGRPEHASACALLAGPRAPAPPAEPGPRTPAASALFHTFPAGPERLPGRSHADRPEGAAACLTMPSRGESP